MNNEEIDRLKDAYFAGTSSKEDEKRLKSEANDSFFDALKEEKDQTMDWSFDDFLAIANQEEPIKKVGVFSFRKMTYWAAASVILVVFGAFLMMQNTSIEKPQFANNQNNGENPKTEPKDDTEHPSPEKPIEDDEPLPIKKVKTVSKSIKEAPDPAEQPSYNPEYVVINGKPIYNLEEAKELTMNSLNLLANNVEKSVSGMENVKHLSVKF